MKNKTSFLQLVAFSFILGSQANAQMPINDRTVCAVNNRGTMADIQRVRHPETGAFQGCLVPTVTYTGTLYRETKVLDGASEVREFPYSVVDEIGFFGMSLTLANWKSSNMLVPQNGRLTGLNSRAAIAEMRFLKSVLELQTIPRLRQAAQTANAQNSVPLQEMAMFTMGLYQALDLWLAGNPPTVAEFQRVFMGPMENFPSRWGTGVIDSANPQLGVESLCSDESAALVGHMACTYQTRMTRVNQNRCGGGITITKEPPLMEECNPNLLPPRNYSTPAPSARSI